MAVRRATKTKAKPWDGMRCRDCALSYDWHEIGYNGEPFLCRCPHKQKGGKFSIFLRDRACEKFKPR